MLDRSSLLIATFVLATACAPAHTPSATTEGDLTHVPLLTRDGKPTDLATVAAGRVTVVSLWAPWCEGCRTEEPALLRLDGLARERGDFVLVSIAIGTTVEELPPARVPYAQLMDTGTFAQIGNRRVPATLVLDRSGHTIFEGGALDRESLAALEKALAR